MITDTIVVAAAGYISSYMFATLCRHQLWHEDSIVSVYFESLYVHMGEAALVEVKFQQSTMGQPDCNSMIGLSQQGCKVG